MRSPMSAFDPTRTRDAFSKPRLGKATSGLLPCPLFGRDPPHCGGEHGQEDNWHPYEPRCAGIFSAHNAIEQREAGQSKGCRDPSYERLLLYPSLGCEPWADRNTENKTSSPAHPPWICWHTWISAQLKHRGPD